MQVRLASPVAVTVVVAVAYLAWAGWYTHYHRVDTLAHVKALLFQSRADTSARIKRLTPTAGNKLGYDGQFYAFIATDPVGARPYLDNPAYRYSRPDLPAPGRCRSRLESGCRSLDTPCSWDRRSCGGHLCARDDCRPPRDLAVVRRARRRLPGALSRGVARPRRSPRVRPAVPRFDGLDGRSPTRRRRLALIWEIAVQPVRRHSSSRSSSSAGLVVRERRFREGVKVGCLALAPYVLIKAGLAVWLGSWGYARDSTDARALPWPCASVALGCRPRAADPRRGGACVGRGPRGLACDTARLSRAVVPDHERPRPRCVSSLAVICRLPRSGRISIGVVVAFVLCLPALLQRGKVASVAPDRAVDAPLVHGASGRSETLIRSV